MIGIGGRGSGLIPFINQIPNMRVVACCDIIPFRISSGLSKVVGKAKGYSDYKKCWKTRTWMLFWWQLRSLHIPKSL
ncbi:MAG TPA: hypothetical protein VJ880_05740 [Allomuricauda sp.]|nr:hypothetical protein [Allomuricauda sp.]